ncbi:related to sensory transduction histidine kinase, partial [Cephalotrichum gorgonifer]
MAEDNAPAGANLQDLDRMDDGDSLTQPPIAGPRKSPDTEMATPPNPRSRSRSSSQFSLGRSLGASLTGPVLHEQWTPSISANDLPSDLLAESELLQQPPARDPDARRTNAPHNKRPPGDTLELTARPPAAKRARRALFDAAVDAPEPAPPRSRSLPSRSRWRERGGQMAAEFYSSLRDLSSRAAIGEARSTADSVSKARLAQGTVQVPPGPPKYPRRLQDEGDSCVDASAMGSLLGVGALELLDSDWRPAFVVDLSDPAVRCQASLRIFHVNEILRSSSAMLELLGVVGERVTACAEFLRFKSWILDAGDSTRQGGPPTHAYGGVEWTYVTLRDRFRFVTGNKVPTSYENPPNILGAPIAGPLSFRNADAHGLGVDGNSAGPAPQVASPQPTTKLSFDWTRIPLTDETPEHIRVARSVDWASTPLGPMKFWSSNLRIMANLVMASPHPASLYWGPKNVVIYNEAYVEIAGRKHPSLMGKSYENPFSSIWEQLDPVFRAARQSGESMMKYDDHIFVDRQGYVEEVYFTWSIVPVLDEEGEVVGVYNPAFENTRRRIGERRMLTLRKITEMMSTVTDVEGLWCQLLQGLEPNSYDIPCALIYSVDDDVRRTPSSPPATNSWNPGRVTLEGSIGFPADHPSAIPHLDLRTSNEGFAPYMRQALMAKESPVILSAEDGSLPSSLLEDLELRGFDAPCHTALILAIHASPADADSVVAFAVLGINPRRPFDDDFRLFISLLSCQLETSVASLTLLEEEVRRGRTAAMIAAQDKQKLSKQLIQRTQEAVESEYRFARMAEFAPVGMFIAEPSGNINYCNDMWWEISRYPRAADSGVDTWMDSVLEDDIAEVRRAWAELTEKKIAVTHEFRFNYRRRQNAAGGQMMDTWVLMSAYPEKDAAGNVKSIFGCLTDISSQKWAEYSQKQRREEAVELKRQQENFIDITSHEMRNPLSAILQCADEVLNNIAEFRAAEGKGGLDLGAMLDCCADAANTISFCANHQKRIVDDILTLSKLDSQLLMVTPVLVQPVAVVETVLKMFQTELASRDILVEFCVEQPYLDYGIDWVRIDPSRLRQVVINLMTNAIKFTQNREQRVIVVSVSASKQVGGDGSVDGNVHGGGGKVTYFPRATEDPDITKDEEWGEGEEINLHFSVQDTGPGLTPDEIKVLFQRFSQASPRTHVQYGGSGLGLFVSRMLTELQGGQIGVMSQKGVGSTFTFYIKSRRAEGPEA